MRIGVLCILLLLVSGCATHIKSDPIEVKIPVAVIAPPPVVKAPDLATKFITDNSSGEDVVRAYVAAIKQLQDYADKLNQIVEQYRKQSEEVSQ